MKASERIWWIKLMAALGVAFLTLAVQLYFKSGTVAFMLGVILYMGISDLLSSINKVDRVRSLKIGVGVYFFTWIVTWITVYTYIRTIG